MILGICFAVAFVLINNVKTNALPVFQLLGATAGSMMCFILPSSFYLRLSSMEDFSDEFSSIHSYHKQKRLVAWFMILLGIFSAFNGIFVFGSKNPTMPNSTIPSNVFPSHIYNNFSQNS